MASIIGINVRPNDEMVYSERGGNSGYMVFVTNPSSTSSFNCKSSTRGVASGNIYEVRSDVMICFAIHPGCMISTLNL